MIMKLEVVNPFGITTRDSSYMRALAAEIITSADLTYSYIELLEASFLSYRSAISRRARNLLASVALLYAPQGLTF